MTRARPAAPESRQPAPPASAPAPSARMVLWLATAAACGYAIMAMELAAFRLYAPYFGYSIDVWGGMIATVMGALAGGYAAGGWLADRSRGDRPLFLIILCSAIYQAVLLLLARPLLTTLSTSGEAVGSLLATLVVFAPPVAALAVAGPFVTRLLARAGRVGTAAGKVNSLSTLGSIAGVIATSFWIIPHFGTRAALLTACCVTAATAMAGLLAGRYRVAPLGLLALVPLLLPDTLWPTRRGTVLLDESAYNLLRVVRDEDGLSLILNDGLGAQTVRGTEGLSSRYYYADFALAALLTPGRRVLVLGMGGGESIATTRLLAPDARIEAVEIDPKVILAARQFFDLHPEPGFLTIHNADARPWLAGRDERYDIAQIDLYHGGPYVPFYLTTVEFYESIHGHLAESGVIVLNVFDAGRDHAILDATAATLGRVFPTVLGFEHGRGTWVMFAFPGARSLQSARAALSTAAIPPAVAPAAARASASLQEFHPPAGALVFTDDHAPIEPMTRRMIVEVKATMGR